jgi:ArsR family transcriptional regulator
MSNYSNKDIEGLSGIFKALANPHRLTIFIKLAGKRAGSFSCEVTDGACACVGELGRDLEIVPSTVSHHIKELNRAGLIELERKGQNIYCTVRPEILEKLAGFFSLRQERNQKWQGQ